MCCRPAGREVVDAHLDPIAEVNRQRVRMRVATGSAARRAGRRAATQQYERNNSAHGFLPAWIVPGYNSAVPRRTYIDWARGIAVLLMIEAHTLDAWTRAAARRRLCLPRRDRAGRVRGAAVSVVGGRRRGAGCGATAERPLPARRRRDADGRARGVEMACRRGLEIFLLAFLFRLQGFIVTPGGSPVKLFRVDILNIMGPAMVGVGLLWGAGRTVAVRVAACAVAAVSIGVLTPIVRTASLVNALPIWLQWYMRPTGDLTTFTLFPWAGFVFAGAAVGVLLATATDERAERRLQIILGVSGAALIGLGSLRPASRRSTASRRSGPARRRGSAITRGGPDARRGVRVRRS